VRDKPTYLGDMIDVAPFWGTVDVIVVVHILGRKDKRVFLIVPRLRANIVWTVQRLMYMVTKCRQARGQYI